MYNIPNSKKYFPEEFENLLEIYSEKDPIFKTLKIFSTDIKSNFNLIMKYINDIYLIDEPLREDTSIEIKDLKELEKKLRYL